MLRTSFSDQDTMDHLQREGRPWNNTGPKKSSRTGWGEVCLSDPKWPTAERQWLDLTFDGETLIGCVGG